MTTTFAQAKLALIVASKTNPRKTFNQAKLDELKASIAAMGVHQPILLRPLPASRIEDTAHMKPRPEYELVAGERRMRASIMAGLETIPSMIRNLSDDQALEIQIIENLQRDDLTELEEAEGYETLMQHSTINADVVAEKIGKSRSYVYARLKLLDLSIECKQAMREGKIDSSRAILIARIPDAKLQAKALEEATKPDWRGDVCSVRALQAWLQSNVMLRLENAPFKTTDARLLPEAGSCKDCPKRTGANPDLFADVAGADICTDPACFRSKTEAHRTVLMTKAEAKGMRVIDGKEAKEVFPHINSSMHGYSELGQVRNDCMKSEGKKLTLRDLLGKDVPSPVLIENPHTKELIEAVPTEEAEALLLAKGLIKSTEKQGNLEDEIERLQAKVKDKTAKAQRIAKHNAVVDAIRATTDKEAQQLLPASVLRAWFETSIGYMDADDMALWFGMSPESLGKDPDTAVALHVRACSNAALHRALARFMLNDEGLYAVSTVQLIADAMAKNLAIDTASIEKAAASEVKAEITAEIKRLKTALKQSNAQNLPTAIAPAAQAKGGAGEDKKTKPTLRAPKPKMRAEEAMQGIAAAMQGDEASDSARRSEEIKGADAHSNDGGADCRPTGSSHDEPDNYPAVDPLLVQAIDVIAREQKANMRLLKSELKVGTSKALDLMAKLEAAGKVSACDERGARKVLVRA